MPPQQEELPESRPGRWRKRSPEASNAAEARERLEASKRLRHAELIVFEEVEEDSGDEGASDVPRVVGLEVLVGRYEASGERHDGHDVFHKVEGGGPRPLFLYFSSSRSEEVTGWWFSDEVGGNKAWCFAEGSAFPPPASGWLVPIDEAVPVRGLRVKLASEQSKSFSTSGAATAASAASGPPLREVEGGTFTCEKYLQAARGRETHNSEEPQKRGRDTHNGEEPRNRGSGPPAPLRSSEWASPPKPRRVDHQAPPPPPRDGPRRVDHDAPGGPRDEWRPSARSVKELEAEDSRMRAQIDKQAAAGSKSEAASQASTKPSEARSSQASGDRMRSILVGHWYCRDPRGLRQWHRIEETSPTLLKCFTETEGGRTDDTRCTRVHVNGKSVLWGKGEVYLDDKSASDEGIVWISNRGTRWEWRRGWGGSKR